MKAIIILIFCCIAVSVVGQTKTISLGKKGNYEKYQNKSQEDAWMFRLPEIILTDEDTLFVDGDTILEVFDTVIVNIPFNLTAGYYGTITLRADTINAYSGNGDIQAQESACNGCVWVSLGANTINSPDPAWQLNIELRSIRMRIIFLTSAGTFKITNGNLVLKDFGQD